MQCRAYACLVASTSGNAEYLVKWQGLPYSECTQEDAELIQHHFPLAVDEYNRRQKSACLPSKNCKVCTSIVLLLLLNCPVMI